MARRTQLQWSSRIYFLIGFVCLCILLYGNESFVWKQEHTTIMITTNNANLNDNNLNPPNSIKIANTTVTDQHLSLTGAPTSDDNDNNNRDAHNYNLYISPYEHPSQSVFLSHYASQSDYLSFGKCIQSINQDSRFGKCTLSKYILFDIQDLIGTGNHGKIMSSFVLISDRHATVGIDIPLLNVNLNVWKMSKIKYALKYSDNNDTCHTLQFEYNIMRHFQTSNNMELYHLTDLHEIVPWIEWTELDIYTRKQTRKCVLIMKEIENVHTLAGVMRKKYAPSFEFDHGVLGFVMNCYHDLKKAFDRLHVFNYYHIDINDVNIMVWPRHEITSKRECYLIDFGGVFAMNYDAKSDKFFTGKSHNYSPFAYYYLYSYQERKRTNWNISKLSYYAKKDNEYRMIVEIVNFYLKYAWVDHSKSNNSLFEHNEWGYILKAQEMREQIEHVIPVGINTNNATYMQRIWCLRQTMIGNIKKSNLGSNHFDDLYNENMKNEFFDLLRILETAVHELNAIDAKICERVL